MKENLKTVLITAATTVFILALAGIAKTGTLAMPDLGSGAPTVVSYQGQVILEGTPYDDDGYFKFAVVNEGGDYTYWSNDGSSEDGMEPETSVDLVVTKGLFNVLLGDDSIENMSEPLYPDVFADTERYLRVWFSDTGESFVQLDPDRRITAVPYALQAQEALEAGNADTVDGEHASDLELPSAAMVLGGSKDEITLINAGLSHTGQNVGNYWSTRAGLPTGRGWLAAAAVDGIIYAIGGVSLGNDHETANEAYDPATDSWITKTDMPTGRSILVTVAVDGIIYAIGGYSTATSFETTNEAYDPASDSWVTKEPMPTGRYGLAAAAVDGVIYIVGGRSSVNNYETANEAYDPTSDTWSTKADMPLGRRNLKAATVDGVIYAIGGNSGILETTNEAYNPLADSWSAKAPMPTGRNALGVAVVNGVVYAIGGGSSVNNYETANEAYDPATDSWSIKADMPTGRDTLVAVTVDWMIYAIGGRLSHTWETANEAYNPALYVYIKP